VFIIGGAGGLSGRMSGFGLQRGSACQAHGGAASTATLLPQADETMT